MAASRRATFLDLGRRLGAGALLALLVVLMGCQPGTPDSPGLRMSEEEPPLAVATMPARQETSLREVRNYIGSIKPNRQADLAFPLAGRIATLKVREGDSVEEGEVLATLDARRLEAKRDRIADAVEGARKRLADLDPDAEALTLEQTRVRAQQLRQQLNALEQDLAAIPQGGDPAAANAQRLIALEQQVQLLNATRRQEEIEQLREQVSELEGELADVELELEGAQLTAPFAGSIEMRWATVGSVVAAGSPVVRLAEATRVAWVGIPVPVAARLKMGQTVWLTVGGVEVQGQAVARLPQVDASTRTRTVLIELEEGGSVPDAVAGDVVNIQFYVANPRTGFWLPLTALHREFEGLWSVLVAQPDGDGHVSQRRYIEIERLENDRALVSGSLAAGDEVIVEGGHRVVPGQRVTPLDVPVGVTPPARSPATDVDGDGGDAAGKGPAGGRDESGKDDP